MGLRLIKTSLEERDWQSDSDSLVFWAAVEVQGEVGSMVKTGFSPAWAVSEDPHCNVAREERQALPFALLHPGKGSNLALLGHDTTFSMSSLPDLSAGRPDNVSVQQLLILNFDRT